VAAALAALVLLPAAGCAADDPTYTVRRGAALSPGPTQAAVAGARRALHLGDFGEATAQQARVASAVTAAHASAPFALAFFAGDLVYPCGPDPRRPGAEACAFAPDGVTVAAPPAGAPDPAFARLHDGPLAGLAAPPVPVYVALGNHDVATWAACAPSGLEPAVAARRKACLSVARASPRWTMPGRHYLVDEGPARFIVVDSNVIYGDYGGFTLDAEVAFVAAAATGCERRACFLVAHHPPVTGGVHLRDFDAALSARFARLLAAAGPRLRAWLAGHDHDLQHLRTADGLDVLVSGNGATARPTERFETIAGGGALLFGSVRPGLGVLTFHGAGWDYRFEDDRGQPLYCCAASGAGRCEPSGCRAP